MADAHITLLNLNMLLIRYLDGLERELHVPLGPLYLAAALERDGLVVDFRDYQLCEAAEPMLPQSVVDFCADPAPVIGLSCMANLLPFTILAARALKEAWPDRKIVIGGVGPCSVEEKLLQRFEWIDAVAHGEGERSIGPLVRALHAGGSLKGVPGVWHRDGGGIVCNPAPPRIDDLGALGWPALHHIDYRRYAGHNIVTSRGCPYQCTFCSVAPVWGRVPHFRDPEDIVAEMAMLNRRHAVELFLFQDEFFVSSKARVHAFCQALKREGIDVRWKAFARVNLCDDQVMAAMAEAGCVEIRFGIESGSNRILRRVRKGFTIEQASDVVSRAVLHIDRCDTFFIWGFPFETMADFHQTVFQMIAFRLIGTRILPSLLSLLPQTDIFRQLSSEPDGLERLEFYPGLLPEYMITGHEICDDGRLQTSDEHAFIFDFVQAHRDLFPGFFLVDVEHNILPKLAVLREHGFYATRDNEVRESDSCGAHSPRINEEPALGALTRAGG